MTPCDEPFYGVVPGKAAYPIGRVCLPVTFGSENFRTEYLTFEVADFRSSYHTIFGQPMLAKFMAIPHHTYLIMKMPTPNGILSVLGDIMVSYNCESSSSTGVEAYKHNFGPKSSCQEGLPRPARRNQRSRHRGRPRPQIGTRSHQLPQGQCRHLRMEPVRHAWSPWGAG
jgi:hypothetical protein